MCDFFEPLYANVFRGEKQSVEYHLGGLDWLVHIVPTLTREEDNVEAITLLVVDITDFKKLEKEIRLVGERLEFLLAQSPAIIYSADPNCEFETTFISKNLETIHGYLPEKYYKFPHFWMNITHPEDIDEALKWVENIDEATKQINKSLVEKGAFEVEYHLQNQDGSYCWIQDRGRLIYDDAGNALEVVGCMIDVTEQKQAQEELNKYRRQLEELVTKRTAALEKEIEERKVTEQSLRESEERFRQLVENIHQVFWMWDIKTEKMLYVSPAYEKIWGKTCQSLYETPASFPDSVHPQDRQVAARIFGNRLQINKFDEEYRIIRSDKEVRWIKNRAFPIYNDKGEVYRIAGIAEDCTEQKRTGDALKSSEAHYRLLAESVTEGVGIIQNKKLVFVNTALASLLAYPKDDLLRTALLSLICDDHKVYFHKKILDPVPGHKNETEKPIEKDESFRSFWGQVICGDGRKIWTEWHRNSVRWENVPSVFVTVRDITEVKLREFALREEKEISTGNISNSEPRVSKISTNSGISLAKAG